MAAEVFINVYENERWYPIRGWSGKLLPTERAHWSDEKGEIAMRKHEVQPPPKYKWSDKDWELHVGKSREETDGDGWVYATALGENISWSAHRSATCFVRRRMWVRKAVLTDPFDKPSEEEAAGARAAALGNDMCDASPPEALAKEPAPPIQAQPSDPFERQAQEHQQQLLRHEDSMFGAPQKPQMKQEAFDSLLDKFMEQEDE